MANRAKHAYGSRKNLAAAIESGKIDAYDILFLSGEGEEPAIGWVDKDGNPVIPEGEQDVVVVDGESLPADGVEGKIYIFKNEGYVWDGTSFIGMAKDTDVTELEAEIAKKVDAETVDTKIEEAIDDSLTIVEF